MPAAALPIVPLRASLHELALQSADPARLAAFYAAGLGFRFSQDDRGLIGIARERRLRILAGESRRLGYAAYAVEAASDLDALRGRLRDANIASEIIDWPGLLPGAVRFADPDGNLFLFGLAERGPSGASDSADPSGSTESAARRPARIQHVVFASTDAARLLGFFIATMGFVLSDRVVDEAGVLRTAFVRCSPEHHSLAVFAAPENRLDHHCYEAGDWNLIRDWADHFAAQRIALKWGPGRHGPGNNLFVFVHDPDGNWVEISAELERVAPERPVGNWPHEQQTLNSWGIGLLRS
jgi:catechol 2,3-dioxygenase